MKQAPGGEAARTAAVMAMLAAALFLCPRPATAQAPVRSFDQLDTRLKAGETVWVTDTEGQKTKGKVRALDATSLTLNGGKGRTFTAAEVRVVELKRHENLAGGTLVGLGVGLGLGLIGASTGCEGGSCLAGVALLGAMGAGIGCGIDALIPENRRDVIYRAQPAQAGARFSVKPLVTGRAKAVVVSIGF